MKLTNPAPHWGEFQPTGPLATGAGDVMAAAAALFAEHPGATSVGVALQTSRANVSIVSAAGSVAVAGEPAGELIEAAGVFAAGMLGDLPETVRRAIGAAIKAGGALHVFIRRGGGLALALEHGGALVPIVTVADRPRTP